MSLLRPEPRGLTVKLALFFIVVSLPSLLLVEWSMIGFEFGRLMDAVDRGSLAAASERAARELGQRWPAPSAQARESLATWTEALVLRLERPSEGLSPEASFILMELSTAPIAAAVLDADANPLASAPRNAGWMAAIPDKTDMVWRLARGRSGAISLPGHEAPERVRRVIAGVRGSDGLLRGFLLVELRLPLPWNKLLSELGVEWPILISSVIVFGLSWAFFLVLWVTRRLNNVAQAAEAWSQGDFSALIDDRSHDELGRLSAQLNHMAQDLKSLMRSRAQLATLEERQRLARDLHDTVKQKAFA